MTKTKTLFTTLLLAAFTLVPMTSAHASTVHHGHRPTHTCRLHHVYETGPYQLTAGVNLVVDDPCIPRQNAAVQVQNYSGFSLNCQLSGANETIPPYTAVTLSEGGAYQLTISPANVLSNFGGEVNLVWLQPGEQPPVADGVLFQGNTNQGGLSYVQATVTTATAPIILPQPPAGYAYRVHSATLFTQVSNGAIALVSFVGHPPVSPNYVFFVTAIPIVTFYGETFLLNGLLVADSIVFSNQSAITVRMLLYYDLVQI